MAPTYISGTRRSRPSSVASVNPDQRPGRPPLWLAAAAVAVAWAALYDIAVWVVLFVRQPVHPDFRIFYVAAEAGIRYGWSSIYDVSVLRSLSSSFPAGQNYIN